MSLFLTSKYLRRTSWRLQLWWSSCSQCLSAYPVVFRPLWPFFSGFGPLSSVLCKLNPKFHLLEAYHFLHSYCSNSPPLPSIETGLCKAVHSKPSPVFSESLQWGVQSCPGCCACPYLSDPHWWPTCLSWWLRKPTLAFATSLPEGVFCLFVCFIMG